MAIVPIAVQLYTLREETARDFAGTLKEVANIGYTGVELAGYAGHTPFETRSFLDDNGLKAVGSHIAIERLEEDLDSVIDENLILGNGHIVVPYLAEDRRSRQGFRRVADSLNQIGEKLRRVGLTLAYHNHDFEFHLFDASRDGTSSGGVDDGETGMDILLRHTNPDFVKLEVDTYWVLASGIDPAEFIRRHSNRIGLLHLKDRDPIDGSTAELGTGDLPLTAILTALETTGVRWLIVEQDQCRRSPLESIRMSFDFLN
jgi:sugar phosphate isomerase/epimerase